MYVLILRKVRNNKMREFPLVVSRDLAYLGELIQSEDFRNTYFSNQASRNLEALDDVLYTETLH